ncbi:hypothetical protein ABZ820_15715 [Streptomyces diacarni]|uniref:hypothetical protein n=1 Tax=Streptomyces diacarni TaxID=2800381 RepID=UPI0033EA8CB4
MRAGHCWWRWHRGHADDVETITVIERGTGPAAEVCACLPCARRLAGQFPHGQLAKAAVAAMEKRAAVREAHRA